MTETTMAAVIADMRHSLAELRADLSEFRERVIRVEMRTEHLAALLKRIEDHTESMSRKLDTTNTTIAQGVGGMRVWAWIGHALAAVGGFLAAHFLPPSP